MPITERASMGKRTRRKQARRTASGRISTAGVTEDVRAIALAQPHRRWLPERLRKDQRAENALGRLYLAGFLSEGQVLAGEKFRRLMLEYAAVIEAPRLPPTIMARLSVEIMGRPEPIENADKAGSVSEVAETEESRRARVLNAVERVRYQLRARDETSRAWRDLYAVTVEDKEPQDIVHLVVALNALAAAWRTFDNGKRPIRGTTDGDNHWGHDERIVEIRYVER